MMANGKVGHYSLFGCHITYSDVAPGIFTKESHGGGGNALTMMNDNRTHCLSSGCHIAVGDVAPQIVVAGMMGCVVFIPWCGVVP
jgi:hypothetical protein